MGFSVDFSDFEKFAKSVQGLEKGFNDFLKLFLVEMAERVLAKAKPKTPVDTGALRSAWELGDVSGSGNTLEVEILNGMEYATDIEYGHRIVRGGIEVGYYNGRFMLKTSIDEVRRQMPLRYVKEFEKFCKSLGIK